MSEFKENVEKEKEEEKPLSFTIVKENPREILTFISALSKLTDEMPLILEPEKIWLRTMDSAHVAIAEFEVNRYYFDDYDAQDKQKISILLDKPLKFLRGVKKDEKVTFTPRNEKLAIITSNHHRRTFTTPLLEASETEFGKPKVEYPVKVTVETSQLIDALSDVSKITDRVKLVLK